LSRRTSKLVWHSCSPHCLLLFSLSCVIFHIYAAFHFTYGVLTCRFGFISWVGIDSALHFQFNFPFSRQFERFAYFDILCGVFMTYILLNMTSESWLEVSIARKTTFSVEISPWWVDSESLIIVYMMNGLGSRKHYKNPVLKFKLGTFMQFHSVLKVVVSNLCK
jgi:hypothetical protein